MEPRRRAEVTGLGTLQSGTRQRAQLRVRFADIAWTALCFVLAVWAVGSSVGAATGMTAWAYCAAAWILLVVACAMRLTTVQARKRI